MKSLTPSSQDLELRYVPVPRPEEVEGWLKVAFEAGMAAGIEAALEEEAS